MNRTIAAQNSPTQRQLNVTRTYGVKLERITKEVEAAETELRAAAGQLSDNLLARLRAAPPQQDVSVFRPVAVLIRDPMDGVLAVTREYRTTIAETRSMGVQQAVNAAMDRTLAALDRLIEDYESLRGCGDEAIAVIDGRAATQLVATGNPARRAVARRRRRR